MEWNQLGKLRTEPNALDPYLDELAAVFDFAALRQFRVVVDCCSGTSSLILRRMNERFGVRFILINEKMQGVAFAHEPATNRDMVALQLAPLMKPLSRRRRISVRCRFRPRSLRHRRGHAGFRRNGAAAACRLSAAARQRAS